jgi:WD40 repeat protein
MPGAGVSATLTYLTETRGTSQALDAFVVDVAFDRMGAHACFALGDGTLRLVDLADLENWRTHQAHKGAVLALAQDSSLGGFVSGGDDGHFRRLSHMEELSDIFVAERGWVEHVAGHMDLKSSLLACSVKKTVHVFDHAGRLLKSLEHPSTVAGLAFDAKGKRVAAAHYNGASLWFVAAKTDNPRKLEWKGSHTGIVVHPDGGAVVTSMQENALHGWRLEDGQDMRMSGYPAKTESMSFSRNGKWLATGGADAVVLWPFFGGGPMGKPPVELAAGAGVLVTRVACHPTQDVVAAGFADGMMIIADIASRRVLPAAPPGGSAITALAWNASGAFLAWGTEDGRAGLLDLTAKD